jgi:hypothetical protein
MDTIRQPTSPQQFLENFAFKYSKWIITFSSLAVVVGIIPRFINFSPTVCRRTLLAVFDLTFALLYLPKLKSSVISTLAIYSGFVVLASSVLGFFLILTPSMKVRWAALPILLSIQLVLFAFVYARNIDIRHSAVHLLSIHGICIWLLHITALLYVEKFTLPPNLTGSQRLLEAYKMLYNVRRIGLPSEAPDIRAHRLRTLDISSSKGRPHQRTTRLDFTLSRVATGLLCWALCDRWAERIILFLAPEIRRRETFALSQQGFVRRLLAWALSTVRLSLWRPLSSSSSSGTIAMAASATIDWPAVARELRIKTVLTMIHFGWSIASLTGVHATLSLLFVSLLRLDEPQTWPPLFLSTSSASAFTPLPLHVTSLRAFWQRFWHSMLYRGSVTFARLIALNGLHLQPGHWPATVVIRGAVFGLSATIHVVVGVFSRSGCEDDWETGRWWMGMFVAMVLEAAVVEAVTWCVECWPEGSWVKRALRCGLEMLGPWVGRVWVFVYLLWSVGRLEYRKYHCWGDPDKRLKMAMRAMEEPTGFMDIVRRAVKG